MPFFAQPLFLPLAWLFSGFLPLSAPIYFLLLHCSHLSRFLRLPTAVNSLSSSSTSSVIGFGQAGLGRAYDDRIRNSEEWSGFFTEELGCLNLGTFGDAGIGEQNGLA